MQAEVDAAIQQLAALKIALDVKQKVSEAASSPRQLHCVRRSGFGRQPASAFRQI